MFESDFGVSLIGVRPYNHRTNGEDWGGKRDNI